MRIKTDVGVLASIFIAVHLLLYFQLGVVTSGEAEKYIYQASLLLEGEFPSADKYYFYLPIILLIALTQKLSLGYGFVALAQTVISFFSITLFYSGTLKVYGRRIAFIAALFLCSFIPYHSWNFYLYSESVFFSLSLVLYYLLCRFEIQGGKLLILIFTTIVSLIFSRPFGALFIPAIIVYLIFSKFRNKRFKHFTVAGSFVFFLLMFIIIDRILHGGEDMNAMKPFIEEHIVCFVPQSPNGVNLKLKYYDNGVKDILYYIFHNPIHFAKLMAQRLFSFFSFIRPWYSVLHNYILAAVIIPVYIMFFSGIHKFWKIKVNIRYFTISLIILYPLATTFQCDDWSSRFTHIVMPLIFIVAAFGSINMANLAKGRFGSKRAFQDKL